MPSESEVLRHYEAVADNFTGNRSAMQEQREQWASRTLAPQREVYDAQDVTLFLKKYCQEADHMPIQDLVRRYENVRGQNLTSFDEVLRLVEDFMRSFDELFFFGLLRRQVQPPVSDADTIPRKRPMVELKVFEHWDDGGRLGSYDKEAQIIQMWAARRILDRPYCKPEDLIATLAHEMVHAYLDIFVDIGLDDNDGTKWINWVHMYGHSEMFLELHWFILDKLYSWTEAGRFSDLARADRQSLEHWRLAMSGALESHDDQSEADWSSGEL
ncbi:Uu.00g045040.m01.CDS01 [Anthostomella pinea]|uniref:Uu.00g045040.m01.CDS01 n=1 Tax=Anthostomella pinea TaxID=933095 RepID=A0AAI8VB37_9PEZI|nr:Uu.00g045040.m01.CDS01 [Anthostomella pinea]